MPFLTQNQLCQDTEENSKPGNITRWPHPWRRGVVASIVRRMNEVTLRRAWLVLRWVSIPSRYVTSHIGQLSLASLWGR